MKPSQTLSTIVEAFVNKHSVNNSSIVQRKHAVIVNNSSIVERNCQQAFVNNSSACSMNMDWSILKLP